MDVAQTYNDLADQYHLIFEDWDLSIERQAATLSSILQRSCGLSNPSTILDCACGIGTQSLGLAKLGFEITGCDISPRAVERAHREAARRNLSIQFSVANMLNLTGLAKSDFDAVICIDNSLPHLESADDLLQAAKQMHSRLHPGGFLLASIRDYDRLVQERPTVQGPSFYRDDGRGRIIFQVWDWLDDRRYIFHLYITREIAQGWQTFHATGLYRAIRRDELGAVLREAGFRDCRWLTPTESRFYQPIVLAEAV